MTSLNSQRQAAKAFVQKWLSKGYKKGETQRCGISLLHNVFWINDPKKMMEFEFQVKSIIKEKDADFIDTLLR